MKLYPFELDFSLAPETSAPVYIHEQVEPLDLDKIGPYVRTKAGEILCIGETEAYVSSDEGQSWQSYSLFTGSEHFVRDTRSLCMTDDGVIIVGFLDMSDVRFRWHKKINKPTQNTHLHLWSVRSLDGGKNWEEPVLVQRGYCGATTTMIQLSDGALVMSAQNLDYENGRHYSLTYRSEDKGQSWIPSNFLDIGGRGHHDGCYEGTLVELNDGRLWYVIRTNLDWFWHVYSDDGGVTWLFTEPGMVASSSPGMILRLKSGRLLLAYNQLYPENLSLKEKAAFRRVSGLCSQKAASWQREELSIRFSDDDGKNWEEPIVIARCKDAWLSYCYLFESTPGEIWLTTMQSHLKLRFLEEDFF